MNININNLNHKRIMKQFYNCSINYIISFMLAFPMIALIVLKYALKVVAKILKAIRTIVQVSIVFIRTSKEELVKALSVRD